MIKMDKNIWQIPMTHQFAEVLTTIDDQTSMQNFLRDVMTEKEIREISARLEAAQMLVNKDKYKDITKKTQLSSRTVARISDWLQHGYSGYADALKIITNKTHHTIPA